MGVIIIPLLKEGKTYYVKIGGAGGVQVSSIICRSC